VIEASANIVEELRSVSVSPPSAARGFTFFL
jgi:hypothetical protein